MKKMIQVTKMYSNSVKNEITQTLDYRKYKLWSTKKYFQLQKI